MKARKAFLLRMNPALYKALEAWAAQEFRSLNGQIEYLLQEALAKHRKGIKDENADQSEPSSEAGDS